MSALMILRTFISLLGRRFFDDRLAGPALTHEDAIQNADCAISVNVRSYPTGRACLCLVLTGYDQIQNVNGAVRVDVRSRVIDSN